MKKLFVFIFLVSALNLMGQDVNPTQKGHLMVGGGGSISYFTFINETSGNFALVLNPSIGWFLSDGLALGIGPTFYITSSFGDYGSTHLGIGTDLFIAKYFNSGVFIKGSTGYTLYHNFDTSEYDNDFNTHNINIIPEVGYAFFLGPNVALELSLTNTFNIMLSDGSNSYYNNSAIKAGFQIFL